MSGRNYEGLLDAVQRNNNIGALRRGLGTGDIYSAMDKVQALDEDTGGSGSGSGFSDLSALENETDDFGRRLLQHQRDAARLKAVRGNQQAFGKAIPRPRIAGVLDREERQNRPKETDHQRSSSGGSHESEPPVTVPREWGTKAKKQPHWMRKILEPSENGDAEEAGQGVIFNHRTGFTGDRNWQDTNKPVPSIERTPPNSHSEQPSTPPSSLRHMNTTLKPGNDADENDFSSVSLLASTPAQTRQSRKIDHLARREMEDLETLEKQGVTSKTLSQMNQLPGHTIDSKAKEVTASSRLPRRRRSLECNQENVPPHRERNAISTRGAVRTTEATNRAALSINAEHSHRPNHKRNDSMNLLRKLARVSSSKSPSPHHGKQRDALEVEADDTNRQDPMPLSAKSANSDYIAGPQRPIRRGDLDTEAHRRKTNIPGQTASQSSNYEQGPADGVPETPIVTAGAWIDTTLHVGEDEVKRSAQSEQAVSGPDSITKAESAAIEVKSEPAVPKSAVSAILRENQNRQQDHFLGDSTVLSLEDMVHPNDDPTDPTITLDEEALATARTQGNEGADADDKPLTQAEKDRRQESLAVEGLNKHLRAARTSIKDASRGLRRVEHTLTNVEDSRVYLPAPIDQTTTTTKNSSRLGFHHCDSCGGSYHSVWSALWAEVRSCFYTWDPSWKYRLRLTPLGLVLAGWLIWYMLESFLCTIYCHPLYTSRKFYNLDPRAPRFPFVLPTLIFRPFLMRALGEKGYDLMWQGLEAWWHKEVFERFISGGDPCWGLHPAVCRSVEVEGRRRMYTPPRTTVRRVFGSVTRAATATSRNEWLAAATGVGARVVGSFGDALDDVGSMWDDQMVA